jgi:serine/threonine protein kinase
MTSALEWKQGVGYELKSSTQTYIVAQEDMINPIGTGTFGQVYRATDSQSHALAIKRIEKNCGLPIDKIQREIQTMAKMKEINAINVLYALDFVEDPTTFYIVMPCYDKANFTSFIANNNIKSEFQAIEYFRQICYGIMVLHSNNIIHRDLKTDNILVKKCTDTSYPLEYELTIADMGIATEKEKLARTKEVGTYYTMAPEVSTGIYDAKVDVFSLGCIFYKMLTMKEPFASRQKNSPSLPLVTCFDKPLEEVTLRILTQCLQYNKEDRCDLEYILNLLDVKNIYSAYKPIKFAKDQLIPLFPVKKAKDSRQQVSIPLSNNLERTYMRFNVNKSVIRMINKLALPLNFSYKAQNKPLCICLPFFESIVSPMEEFLKYVYQWVVQIISKLANHSISMIQFIYEIVVRILELVKYIILNLAVQIYSILNSWCEKLGI